MLRLAMEINLSVTLVFISCVTVLSWTDLGKFSDISTSHTCNNSGSNLKCNDTCQVTDSTNSGYEKPLCNATPVECRSRNDSNLPNRTLVINGNIIFGRENCTHTTYTFNGISWTISFWARYNGTQPRTLFEVRNDSATLVSINTSYYRVGVNSGRMTLQRYEWTFIVLRMTIQKAVYLDINGTNKFVGVTNIQSNIQILFGPQTNISADVVQIVDARIYSHCLTDREITKLSSGTLTPKLVLQDNCLCPRDAPTVLPGPLNYGIFCRNHNNNTFLRLNNNTHPAEYAVDGDENTYWNSRTTQSANITLYLKNVLQLSSIEIHFLFDTSPSELVLTLSYNGKVSKQDIYSLSYKGKSSKQNICGCTSSQSCTRLGGNFMYNMTKETDLRNRTSNSTLLADKVDIHLNGSCSNKTFYAISEIKITGRNSTTIVFKTMKSNIGTADVNITWFKWKNQNYTFPEPLKFDYRENVSIQKPTSNLQVFASGWCNIELTGTSLNSVYRPEIILYGIGGASNITGTCSDTIGGTSLLCKPPNVSSWVTNGTYSYGVVLDGITDFLNMTTSMIEIQPDPTFNPKEEIVYRNIFDKVITIKGEGFRRACRNSDFRAHLSKRGDCEIKDITNTEIACDPRETFPGTGEKEVLKIYIGGLEKDVGMVEFRTFWKLQEFTYICIGVGGFVLFVIITIIVCCICRQRYRSKNMPEDEHEDIIMRNPNQNNKWNSNVGVANPAYRLDEIDLDKSYSERFMERLPQHVAELVSTSIIFRSHIELGNICTGKGTYTRVIDGKFASYSSIPYSGDGNTIKTLVQNYPAEGEIPNWLNLGLQECTRLRDVAHDNVLRLRGIAIDKKKIYVVYPPMERTLKDYMQKNYSSQEINIDDVIGFCFDVAEGMQELHRHGILHKDLAARNCMTDCRQVIKVADASFASDLYPEEYIKQQNRDLPVRWMAVESLKQFGFYDKATDMREKWQWSYGVLLWEIFTGCRYLPYHDLPNNEIHVNVAMQGYRLRTPEYIPQAYLDIVEDCMNTDSKLRPTFEAMLFRMKATLENPGQVIYQNHEENYVNQSVVDHSHYVDQSEQPALPPRKSTQ